MVSNVKPKRLLIVDDEASILLGLSSALQSDSVDVFTANRLGTAEEALSRHVFDVVITDIKVSGILGVEGLELLTYVKRYWPKTEVLVMTAHGSDEIKKDAYDRGARHYFEKPIDIKELFEQLRSLGVPIHR